MVWWFCWLGITDTNWKESKMRKYGIFYRYNEAPIAISLNDLPIVASGRASQVLPDGRVFGASIMVRRHADGRYLSEAAVVGDGSPDREVSILESGPLPTSVVDEAVKVHAKIRYMGAGYVAGEALESLIKSLPCEKVE